MAKTPGEYRYWPIWEPVPGRYPWRVHDEVTGDYVRSTPSKGGARSSLKFVSNQSAWAWCVKHESQENTCST